ncbi:MAG: DUF1523 family protein [Pseudomonadota bacterium]
MRYIVWGLRIALIGLVVAFLDYTLPRYDTVRITGVYETRINIGENHLFWAGAETGFDMTQHSRDVFFIQTMRPNGRVKVYRNEDTGWGWPPFFKFDTANLQAEAKDMISTADDPKWVAIRRYGWRNEFMSIFPNALSIKPVAGPDTYVIPWGSIAILVILGALFWAIRVRWVRFRERRLNPVIDEWTDGWG